MGSKLVFICSGSVQGKRWPPTTIGTCPYIIVQRMGMQQHRVRENEQTRCHRTGISRTNKLINRETPRPFKQASKVHSSGTKWSVYRFTTAQKAITEQWLNDSTRTDSCEMRIATAAEEEINIYSVLLGGSRQNEPRKRNNWENNFTFNVQQLRT